MSNLTSVDNMHLRVLKFARRLYCLPLPEGFLPPREAVALFRVAATQGHADVQYNLGFCYCNGEGTAGFWRYQGPADLC